MVDRYELKTPLTVVDLDGTYINGNSLVIYIKSGIGECVRSFKMIKVIKILFWIILRKLRITSHTYAKSRILAIIGFERKHMAKFKQACLKRVNSDVMRIIDGRIAQGHRVLLATAAPEEYVKYLWTGDYVATEKYAAANMKECRGDEKLKRVNRWLQINNCRLDTVITDHLDDAPLLRQNSEGTNILVNPNRRTLRFFRELKPTKFFCINDVDEFGVSG